MKKPFIPYKKNLKQFSRNLRNNSTLAEVLLWNELKAGKMHGYKFNRQKPLGKFVVDFYCKKLNLVIEIDGISHNVKEDDDKKRQNELEQLGLKFLRYTDDQIKSDMEKVLIEIKEFIKEFEKNPPVSPFERGTEAI